MPIEYQMVPIEQCVEDQEFNTRTKGLGDLTDLTASIKEEGIIQPLRGKDKQNGKGEIEIYVGFRRLAAAREAGLTKVPVITKPRRKVTRQGMLIANLGENLQREDLNAVDEAIGLQRLQTEHSMSVDDICRSVGVKKSFVQKRFRLLKLSDVVKEAVHDGRISANSAIEIDRLPKEKQGRFVSLAAEFRGKKLADMIDKELAKIQPDAPGTKKEKKEPADKVNHVRMIRQCSSVMCNGLGYSKEEIEAVKDVDFRPLEDDDLKTVAKLFNDCADVVEDEVEINEKAQEEIVKYTEGGVKDKALDLESPLLRAALGRVIADRAREIAEEKAQGSGRRPKVTFAIAQEALDEFFTATE